MNMDQSAAERIKELEDQLEDAYIKIDLQDETIIEQEGLIRTLKAWIQRKKNAQNVDYEVA